MHKVINIDKIESWDLNRKHSEQKYVVEKYSDEKTGFYSIKINSMKALKMVIEHLLQDGLRDMLIYRGQKNSDWLLTSSLEREIKSVKTQDEYNEIAQKHLDNFKRNSRGRIKEQFLLLDNSEENMDELWAIGQHFGLKTPLIDWTRSIFVALFFAFYEENTETEYRCVYRLVEKILYNDKERKYIAEPKMDYYGRLTAQKGLFTYWSIDYHIKELLNSLSGNMTNRKHEEQENIKRKLITKYYISNELRLDVLNYLKGIGVSEETIYPDLSGVINKVNNKLQEIINQSNHSEED